MPDNTTTPRTGGPAGAGTDRQRGATGASGATPIAHPLVRPAGGPNGNGGVRPSGPPRPSNGPGNRPGGGPGARPGGPVGRPGGGPGGRPGGRPGGGPGGRPGGGPGGRPGGGPGGRPGGRPGGHSNGRSNGRGNGRGFGGGPSAAGPRPTTAVAEHTGPVAIPAKIIVKDLAELMTVSVNALIRELIGLGVFASINDVVSYDPAAKVAAKLGFEPEEAAVPAPPPAVAARPTSLRPATIKTGDGVTRPPVVTVMGHVDHGKTSLLDAIRKTKVAAGEAGGITQHIGAYQVEINGRKITFLDTPGHEAFTAMRARGAQVGDIAVLVVAADDGVMPQTKEAIDHARAANVPIVVAINKIDKLGANPDHVKQQLAENDVVIEEYGGDVIAVPVSAKRQEGIEDLLEMVLLVADVQELTAHPDGAAQGVIIEARMEKSSGATATALVQEGTLKLGDTIVAGGIFGKVRAMFDDTGKRIKKAGPSMPVSILGLPTVPDAGDRFEVVHDDKAARTLIQRRIAARQEVAHATPTLDTLYTAMREGKIKELNLLIKADVQGSAEALKHALAQTGSENLKVRLIRDGIGDISETDVDLAAASGAIIIGFNVKADAHAQRRAAAEGVDIRYYDVIYKLVEDIEAALKGLLEPVYKEQVDGHAEVLQTFKAGRSIIIAGCRVTDGKIARGTQARVQRGGKTVWTGAIASLRRGKDDVREVAQGFECGIVFDGFNEVEPNDTIEVFSKVRV